jgi:hypothetical protein
MDQYVNPDDSSILKSDQHQGDRDGGSDAGVACNEGTNKTLDINRINESTPPPQPFETSEGETAPAATATATMSALKAVSGSSTAAHAQDDGFVVVDLSEHSQNYRPEGMPGPKQTTITEY